MNATQQLIQLLLAAQLLGGCQPASSLPPTDLPALLSQYQAATKMDKQEFWRLINFAHAQAKGNEQALESLLIGSLAKYSPAAIIEFECLLEQQLQAANDYGIMAAEKVVDDYVSDDSFLYFRLWLVAQGEQIFTAALRSPDSLANHLDKGAATEFEPLLYVATEAYRRKTGQQQEDESFPRGVASQRGLSYDGGPGAVTTGQDWTPEQLPTRLPRLWAKFR